MDSILSVRINEEVKEKFIKLAEEHGVNNKEFLDLIIKNYEINKASAEVDFVKSDIDELQAIVKRVLDIYLNMIDKSKLRTTELINSFNTSIGEEKERIEGINEEMVALKKQIDELKAENKELKSGNKELQSALSKEKEAIKECREMNVILKEKLVDFNTFKEENINLKEEIASSNEVSKELQGKIYDLQQDYDKCNSENVDLNNKITEVTATNEKQRMELKNSFEEQLKVQENHFDLKLQQELLQKEQGLREEIWILKSNYDEKITTLIKEKEDLLFKISNFQNK